MRSRCLLEIGRDRGQIFKGGTVSMNLTDAELAMLKRFMEE